ncbi:RNA-binding protein [Methylomarinovum caldicuralii]|uniref:RNA-binding protein n=1 Tax=Methylomarinovum caldicuralii TaxID=438856 RepID=A0AAU9CBE1_9GAMM|nr:ribosome assembly RNA-binding protein YhbY [Methylomarinovum caldicuralii]BCX82956.1 RNA-binding protein [Methylomarinovum caldicuralii]
MLDKKQKRHLKARAHPLKPVVITGQLGLTEAVLAEIDRALTAHELIKVRINAEDRQARREMAQQICDRLDAELVQILGHVATLYRENPES